MQVSGLNTLGVYLPQLFGLYVHMTGSILLGPFCSWEHVCFIYNAWPGTYKVKNFQCMEFLSLVQALA